MTNQEAIDILNRNETLFLIAEMNREIPDRSNGVMEEIYSALNHFRPGFVYDRSCGSCALKMVLAASNLRKELKFMTFPKHDKE